MMSQRATAIALNTLKRCLKYLQETPYVTSWSIEEWLHIREDIYQSIKVVTNAQDAVESKNYFDKELMAHAGETQSHDRIMQRNFERAADWLRFYIKEHDTRQEEPQPEFSPKEKMGPLEKYTKELVEENKKLRPAPTTLTALRNPRPQNPPNAHKLEMARSLVWGTSQRLHTFKVDTQAQIEMLKDWRQQIAAALKPTEDESLVESWLGISAPLAGLMEDDEEKVQIFESQKNACRRWIQKVNGFLLQSIEQAERLEKEAMETSRPIKKAQGKRIFIGHGRSPVWRELKDFLKEKLGLEHEEFNREPAAGMHTIERLEQMIDASCFAFLIMTAEDETADGKMRARENVVHEAGLFQGKLGFRKAIILREEGCDEFSNVFGLTQIFFPKGNILAASEKIRDVLRREGIVF
jgi:predicted nucleotide-binding protein